MPLASSLAIVEHGIVLIGGDLATKFSRLEMERKEGRLISPSQVKRYQECQAHLFLLSNGYLVYEMSCLE